MQERLTKSSAKKFNEEWEKRLGLDYKIIESKNHDLPDSLYPHLGPEALYTSFADYYQLFSALPSDVEHVCDLGAGVGRLAPIWKEISPQGSVALVELVESRIKAAEEIVKKLGLSYVYCYQNDLLKDPIPGAEAYFIYLPVSKVLEKIIDEITLREESCYIVSIESHGNLFERLAVWKGLELIQKIELFSERHDPYGHIYKYTPQDSKKTVIEEALSASYKDEVIVIKEKQGEWIGLTSDLVWNGVDEILLCYPPRSVKGQTIVDIKEWTSFSEEVQYFLKLMKDEKEYQGSLVRKIWLSPKQYLEMQNGAKISLPSSSLGHQDQ